MIEINLLPKEYRRRSRTFHLEKKAIYAAVGAGAIVLLFIVVTFYQRYQLSSLDQRIADASAERARLQEDIKLIDGLTVLKDKILQRMEAIEKLDRYRSVWVDVMQDLNQRVPDFMWLTRVAETNDMDAQRLKAAKNVPGQSKADTTQTDTYKLRFDKPVATEIEGYAFTLSSVASLLVGLTKSDYFDNINLAYAKQEEVTGINAYKFRVGCDLILENALNKDLPLENVWEPTIAER